MNCCSKRSRKEPLDQAVCEEPESGALLELATPGAANEDRRRKKKKFEDGLLQTIKYGTFEEIEKEVTPKAFKRCESNALVMGMKVRHLRMYNWVTC